ncbi:HAMP domain-containing histidine kinase [Bacillus tianshenii]|uniref:sensor histidine kinase n=1 Tax=Sutcliffiella tianshenii TaxID=1463404 RepID=UPI001CD7F5AD|nr:HAMP domain-containing sensor histidine kinase [Bacillus tianshenii]MCA1320639.1 HAMP domain-containing histidine kinase [Bacillus tianshenii]
MATKWRNSVLAFLMALVFTGALSGSMYFLFNLYKYENESYFDTDEFQYELSRFINNLAMEEVTLSEEAVKAKITVTPEDIDNHRFRYGFLDEQLANIRYQYEERIQLAESGESDENAEELIAERDAKLEDIQKNFESDEHVEKKVIAEKEKMVEDYFNVLANHESTSTRFEDELVYYASNGNDFITNTGYSEDGAEKAFSDEKMYFSDSFNIDGDLFISAGYWPNDDWMYQAIAQAVTPYVGKIAVPTSISPDSEIMNAKSSYELARKWFWRLGVGSAVALLVWLLIMIKVARLPKKTGMLQGIYEKIPVDVRVGVTVVTAFFTMLTFLWIEDSIEVGLFFRSISETAELVISMILGAILSLILYHQLRFIVFGHRSVETIKKEWSNSLIVKTLRWSRLVYLRIKSSLKEAFLTRSIGIQALVLLAIVFVLGVTIITVLIHPIFFFLYLLFLIVVGVPAIRYFIKSIGYFNRISMKTEEMAAGRLGEDLEIKGKSELAKMAANLNALNQGVKVSINEQAKSERLKTELITNVSHDLRTPLTSIITYTELLKRDDLPLEDRKAYLEIIDRKSQRLKGLIDDLFEVSKMASGNMELLKEKVDIKQLLQQSLAEHDSSMLESNLHFRISAPDGPIWAMVDGQKMWRVFDNLIGNIIKYSLEHSRVYILIQQADGKVNITLKNISKYELNDQSEELYERFKRGDTSRHTEGSGLGLAIAKSIIDLHEGSLHIETDGDLFKVTISLRVVD